MALTEHWRQIQSEHRQLGCDQHYGAPARALRHTAVWTGTEMIVWGGCDSTAASRRLAADTIRARIVGLRPALAARLLRATITRQFGLAAEMIVWGGYPHEL